MLECGRRFADHELPKSTWDLRRYWYAPRLGLNGIFRLTIFKDVAIASGSGVGGGSLGYANTLYRAPARFYEDPQWAELDDWLSTLAPHYVEAERMLGVATYDEDDPADDYLREYAQELGSRAPTPRRASASSWVSRARPSRIPSSAAKGPTARAACAAGAAWSAARTAPRTRS